MSCFQQYLINLDNSITPMDYFSYFISYNRFSHLSFKIVKYICLALNYMQILTMDWICFDKTNFVVTVLIGLTTYYLVRFYVKVATYPTGPIPLPFIGNVLKLRGTKEHSAIEIAKLGRKYGPMFTFWMGNTPIVFIFDCDLARDTFKQNAFSGRPESFFGSIFTNVKVSDVIFDDFGHRWESLRRVTHSAIRKYAVTDKLAYLVSEVVDETVAEIIEKEGINKPFDLFKYNYRLFLNIIAESAFGKRYKDPEDAEYKQFKYFFSEFQTENGPLFALLEFLPFLRPFYRSKIKTMFNQMQDFLDVLTNKYRDHCKDFDENVIRDFCDALILAKNEALIEGKETAPYLKDQNLGYVISDLFMAGVDTSQNTIKWIILLMANYPQLQNKLRQEIDSVIGERMPVQEDRNHCHYVNAFISETMRYRPIAPIGVFHQNIVQSKLGDQTIPSNTAIFVHQYTIMNDTKHWNNPEEFIPERFLENGKYLISRPNAFIPFGTGRRVCLGEKLAITNVFLVLVRFLQSTNGYEIALEGGPGSGDLEPDTSLPDFLIAKHFNIMFKKDIKKLSH